MLNCRRDEGGTCVKSGKPFTTMLAPRRDRVRVRVRVGVGVRIRARVGVGGSGDRDGEGLELGVRGQG